MFDPAKQLFVASALVGASCASGNLGGAKDFDAGKNDVPDASLDGGAVVDCSAHPAGFSQLGSTIDAVPIVELSNFDLAIDHLGRPVVAMSEGEPRDLHAFRFEEPAWARVGNPLSANSGDTSTYTPTLAAGGDGSLYLAFIETIGGGSSGLYAYQFGGSQWDALGGGNLATTNPSVVGMDMVVGDDGVAVLASSEYLEGFIGRNRIHVRRFDGNMVEEVTPILGGIAGPGASAITPRLVLRPGGGELVLFSESGVHAVERNTGDTDWVNAGGPISPIDSLSGAHSPRLSLTSSGTVLGAVAEFDETTSTANGFVVTFNGSSWLTIGGALDEIVDEHMYMRALAVDTDDNPVVAFSEAGQLYVQSLGASGFETLSGLPLVADDVFSDARVVADECGFIIAIADSRSGERALSVWRYRKL